MKFNDSTEIPNLKHTATLVMNTGVEIKTSDGTVHQLTKDLGKISFTSKFSFTLDSNGIRNIKTD